MLNKRAHTAIVEFATMRAEMLVLRMDRQRLAANNGEDEFDAAAPGVRSVIVQAYAGGYAIEGTTFVAAMREAHALYTATGVTAVKTLLATVKPPRF